MQAHVKVNMQNISVDETFEGATADEIVGKMKARVAREMSFIMRSIVNGFSNLGFAQEVVKRYNSSSNQNLPIPNSCDEFLTLAQEQGFATIS